MSAKVEFTGVRKIFYKYGEPVEALGPVTFNVKQGEFLSILGPSGCGKSTTLNLTAGLMRPNAGSVRFDGKEVKGVNTRVGYLTQKDSLLPWRTVEANIALPLEVQGISGPERADRVKQAIKLVSLTSFERHYPSELSGGMRKRVGLARMLVSAPDTLLLDEPFGALDAQLRMQLQQELLDLWNHDRKTVIFVTHDMGEAVKLSDRIIIMTSRPGKIKGVFDVPLSRPRDLAQLEFDQDFILAQREVYDLIHGAARMEEVTA